MLSRRTDGVSFGVKLTPKASKNALDRMEEDGGGALRLRATVTAVPEKGKANAALVKLLAKKLALPKSRITIIAGEQSRLKTILVSGEAETLVNDLIKAFENMGFIKP